MECLIGWLSYHGNKIGFVELKSPENRSARLSKLQVCQIRFLRSLDCSVEVLDSESLIDGYLEKLQKG